MSGTLYDASGKVIERKLDIEIVKPSIEGVRSPFDPMVAAGLTVEGLAQILSSATQGDIEQYLVLATQMEQRDCHYFSVLQTRKWSVAYLPRLVEAPTDKKEDIRLAELVKVMVHDIGFTEMLIHALDALNKSFSVIEIIWELTPKLWKPKHYIFKRQNWFQFDQDSYTQLRIRDANVPEGIPLDPYKYIVHHPVVVSGQHLDGGLARQVAAMHLFKSYALKSWMAFAEVFGMPIRIGKYAPGADPEDVDALRRAVTQIGADAAAIIPTTMMIEFQRAAASGFAGSDEFFVRLTNWLDRQVSKAVLGQNMIDEDGGSFAKSKTLQLVRDDIRNADARQLEDTINRDLIKPFIDLNFGPRELYPKFKIDTREKEDLLRFSQAAIPFIDRGLEVEMSVIRDKFDLPEPAPGAQLISPAGRNPIEPQEEDDQKQEKVDAETYRKKYWGLMDLIDTHTNMKDLKRTLSNKETK